MNPNIAILILSHLCNQEREEYTVSAIRGLIKNLKNKGGIGWYIAEGYGNKLSTDSLLHHLIGYRVLGWHSEKLTPGANWNKGLIECYKHTDYVLVMEDDWLLPESFNITPYVKLLQERPEVAMVRFGTLTLGMICHVQGHDGRHYLEMDHKPQYAFSGNPHLRHKRLNQAIGLYNENITPSPGDVEIDFDYRFRQQNELKIWRPASIDGWGIFQHIGNVQSYEVD